MNALIFLLAATALTASPVMPDAAASFETASIAQQAQVEPVDINAADAEKLQEVPGIGETLARRIVEFRGENGPFETVDELLNVRGIGVNSLEKLRPYLKVETGG